MKKDCVLITGASSGFGLLLAIAFAEKGWNVVATMRDTAKATLLVEEARKRNVAKQIIVKKLDVTNATDLKMLKEQLHSDGINVQILINNAGYCQGGPTEGVAMEKWKHQFDTNVLGAIAVTKAFLPDMRKRRQGRIIMLSSISGRFGFPALGPYSASKFALEGFSESLRFEMLPFGVYVSLVEPGPYRTSIWEKGLEEAQLSDDEDYKVITQTLIAQATHSATSSNDPISVVNKIVAISKVKRPKLRYPIGKSTKLMIILKALLPMRMIEYVVLRKLNGKT
ncbi:SDR family oxidoreductase [Alkalicoccobacillus gibsonii]|uniref:SDR family oxidoreductase n=1 Tax=Alkalicoccobacillus gibsonii TaxID=79881 RepID=UPI003F7C0943